MKYSKNTHGFTLVELLVAISILGIITIIALPQISNIQNNNQKTRYKKYAETMLVSGKLYVDAYTEDMFGNNTTGCVDIPYNDMRAKNLLKAIKVDGATCDFDKTFIRVRKKGDEYTYETSIYCKDKNGNVVYDETLSVDGCNDLGPDVEGPTITFNKSGINWTNNENQTIKILVYDKNGLLENIKVKYIWLLDGTEIGEYKTYSFKNKRGAGKSLDNAIESSEILVPYSTSGEYSLKVIPIDVRDINGNYQLSQTESGKFKIDKINPTCAGNNGTTTWTANNRTINVSCTDDKSGCTKTTFSKTFSSGTVKTSSLTIKDNAGNTTSCTFNVYVDKEAPNAPTTGAIGKVSGSNTTGTIQTASSNTTDVNNGSGFKEIRYVVTNKKSTPTSSSFTSNSRNFTRSCGTSYYAYAAAVDNVGNISSAYYLGTTSDGVNSYNSYGTCSKTCGGGIKTRTNTCALVTTGLSASCNEQDCCSSTKTNWNSWGSCSKTCGGGTRTRTGTIVSTYDGSYCGSDSESERCNSRDCCSSTTTSWGSWSSCSASCGGGTKERYGDIYSDYDGSYCGWDYDYKSCNTHACEPEPDPEPTYAPNDCNIRGSSKKTQGYTWSCTCGRTHSTGYTHYCTDSSGRLWTREENKSLVKFSWVCPISPYGPAQGWTVIDD